MALKIKHPVISVFPVQARGIEDAVLSLLGEQAQESAEPTLSGTPDWGLLDRLEPEAHTRQHSSRVATGARFKFATRRSAEELPWSTLAT